MNKKNKKSTNKVHLDKPKEQNSYYRASPQNFDALIELIDAHPMSYSIILNAKGRKRNPDVIPQYKYLNDWINEVTAFALSDPFYTTPTKCWWILHDLHSFPVCSVCGNVEWYKHRNVHLWNGYFSTCSAKCKQESESTKNHRKQTCQERYGVDNVWQSEEHKLKSMMTKERRYGDRNFKNKEKAKETVKRHKQENPNYLRDINTKCRATCLRNFGYENSAQCPEVQIKAHKKYFYNGMMFDSSIEIEYLIWMVDKGESIERAQTAFEYEFYGKTFYYIPDFYLPACNVFVELKGDHFFKEDGTMTLPWRSSRWTDEKYEYMCKKIEAKHQCMIHNGIKLLKQSSLEVQTAHEYVIKTYGKDYVKQFRYVKPVNKE